MPSESNNTTLPRRVLGRRLRELREGRQMSRANAARACEMGSQTLWRLETGRISEIKRMVINALCDLYEADDDERRTLLWLVQESRKEGWWQRYGDAIIPEVETFFELEYSACRLFSWQSTLLPGLVQTMDYRRATAFAGKSILKQEVIDVERDVGLLMKRQERLDESERFVLEVLVSESVLWYRIGGALVMAEQLRHLAEIGKRPNISIQVVRFSDSSHIGLTTKDFALLEFPEHPNPALSEPPVVSVEGFTGAMYLDKPDEIEQYRVACADIGAVALTEDATRELLLEVAKEHEA